MLREYMEAALDLAHYELIGDEEPYYGEAPGLQRVRATGRTFEECRRNRCEVIEGWVLIRLDRGLPIPPASEMEIALPGEMALG
jgi:predicted RNase H-like HicB family nuclease